MRKRPLYQAPPADLFTCVLPVDLSSPGSFSLDHFSKLVLYPLVSSQTVCVSPAGRPQRQQTINVLL